MFRKILVFFILMFCIPAYSGELENALKNNDYVVLYIYTPECGYCKKFNPVYDKLVSKYSGQSKFIKVNGNTQYGYSLVRKYHVGYVPFVMIFNNKISKAGQVATSCLIDYSCFETSFTGFIKL